MSHMDGMDAFNRVLERVEELAEKAGETWGKLQEAENKIRQLEKENKTLKLENAHIQKLERYVESTPERLADWQAYNNPPAPVPKHGDDQPF